MLAGFLPLSAGNVKTESLSAIYRESPIFQRRLRVQARVWGIASSRLRADRRSVGRRTLPFLRSKELSAVSKLCQNPSDSRPRSFCLSESRVPKLLVLLKAVGINKR